jgi:succinate dehydrogenase/fumarate reductase flavoprotein subunit
MAIPVTRCGVLVIGSGAAALATAERLAVLATAEGGPDNIGRDVLIATESLLGSTSYNTGSDKQTYYRLSLTERSGDSPHDMAKAIWQGGAVHGDIALAEAIGSAEAFYRLVAIGVPFPTNDYGAHAGYKTDHDPRRRGTSIGPYTSRAMVQRLLHEVRLRNIPILDGRQAVALVTTGDQRPRIVGALFVDLARLSGPAFGLEAIVADAVVFGTGGPGDLYGSSVYPAPHHSAIGLAIEVGAACVNLTESQFGLASLGFRWNVSGSYQQVVPRYVSVGDDGDEEEFLTPYFGSPGKRDSVVFLKGYQWPFDPRKVAEGGSSLVDLLVHRERLVRGRRVYMDFRRNPADWNPASLSAEAREYLEKSGALTGTDSTPIERLLRMNPLAVQHYLANGIDLRSSMLEVAVCAQHCNGGLAADAWWESTSIERLFPVGEVNGSHGVYRPGGSALNAGQVGAQRAARCIVHGYARTDLREGDWQVPVSAAAGQILDIIRTALHGRPDGAADFPDTTGAQPAGVGVQPAGVGVQPASVGAQPAGVGVRPASVAGRPDRAADSPSGTAGEPVGLADPDAFVATIRSRMDRYGGIIRESAQAAAAAGEAMEHLARFRDIRIADAAGIPLLLRSRQLALTHAAYLRAIADYVERGGGSRGSALYADSGGQCLHPALGPSWQALPEQPALQEQLQELVYGPGGFAARWIDRRPIPDTDDWFEHVWQTFREGLPADRRQRWS